MNKEYNMLKDREVPQLGVELKDKNILLMVTGGIASYKMPSLVRRFREHGAFVRVYLSKSAANPETSFVSKNAGFPLPKIIKYIIYCRKFIRIFFN